jgi:subtilisin family serine protease
MRLKNMCLASAVACLVISLTACSDSHDSADQEAAANNKIKVASLDDMPRVVYPIDGPASELLMSDEFPTLVASVRTDVDKLLDEYDIQDTATLQVLYGVQQRIDFLNRDYESAIQWMEKSRALEDKEANRLTAGLTLKAWVAARAATIETGDQETFKSAFAEYLSAGVSELPWEVIQDSIEQEKGYAEFISDNLLLGIAQSDIDPGVAKAGELTEDAARSLIGMRYNMEMFVPVKDQVAAVYSRLIAANRIVKPDIWAARSVSLDADSGARPVVIGIWDAGVDATVFEGSLWTNRNEKLDGTDTDGNGYVDDVHGIGFDVEGHRTSDLLHPHGDMTGNVDDAMSYLKGFMDLTSSIDSDEASDLKKYISGLQPEEVKSFITAVTFASFYMHGTHVTGIAIEGNPYAQVLISRYTFDYHMPRRLLTTEIAHRYAKSHQDAVDYFKLAGVRTVNMSWGWTLKEVERVLEANGVTDPDERKAKTAEIFGILKTSLYDALASAPEILFVTAAGNDDNDVEFDEVIPSNFDLPNVMVVAAVDQAGDPTSFTSGGKNVVIYANGFEVASYVPGGGRMKASGTSMASPNTLNLAAKLFALDPELTAADVMELIARGATPRDGNESMLLIHPKQTIEILRQRL